MLVHISALIAQPLVAECTQALCKCGLRTLRATLQKTQTPPPRSKTIQIYRNMWEKREWVTSMCIKCILFHYIAKVTCQKVHMSLRDFSRVSATRTLRLLTLSFQAPLGQTLILQQQFGNIKLEDEKRNSNTGSRRMRGELEDEAGNRNPPPPPLSEGKNNIEIRLRQTSYLLHGRVVWVESLLELDDEERGSEQPDASAAATLRHLSEAGSSTAKRWPQRRRLDSLTVLSPPLVHPCAGLPPSLQRRIKASRSNSTTPH